MFSITHKRSAATLGVVAGLLAAAAPASAQILDGPILWDTPRANHTWGPIVYVGTDGGGPTPARNLNDLEVASNYLKAAGTETGNPERKGSLNASGGWDPTLALNSQGIALRAVATAVVGGLVPGGAIVSA